MMQHILPWAANFSKKSKSKTPEPCRPCTNPAISNHMTQPPYYTYQPPVQPPNFQQQQVYPHHQPIHMPLSPCPYQCPPQQQIIQSPQQSVTCQQMRNSAVFDSRPNGMVMSSQVQLPLAQQYFAAPTLTNNQVHPAISGQTPRTTDNPYYSNQTESMVMQQQHQQQQQAHHNQNSIQQHHQNHFQQHQQNHQIQQVHNQQHTQGKTSFEDPQRNKLQHQQQHQQHTQQQQQFQQQQQQQHHQQQPSQYDSQRRRQQHSQVVNSQYQQYQNHNQIATEMANRSMNGTANETKELSIEVLCLIHDKGWEELTKMANELKKDLKDLNDELEVIRRETPVYSVNEAQI